MGKTGASIPFAFTCGPVKTFGRICAGKYGQWHAAMSERLRRVTRNHLLKGAQVRVLLAAIQIKQTLLFAL
jgi:hypothetical protein